MKRIISYMIAHFITNIFQKFGTSHRALTVLTILFLMMSTTLLYASNWRIISLKPAITDILLAMNQKEKIVGITKFCNWPHTKQPSIIGDYTRPFIEKITYLNPTIILTSKENSNQKSVQLLHNLHLPIRFYSFDSLKKTKQSILQLGQDINAQKNSQLLITHIDNTLTSLQKKYQHHPIKHILFIIGQRPLIAAGPHTYISELLPIIRAKNVIAHHSPNYPHIDDEYILSLQPDVIIDLSMMPKKSLPPYIKKATFTFKHAYYRLNIANFRPGINVINGLQHLAKIIHRP